MAADKTALRRAAGGSKLEEVFLRQVLDVGGYNGESTLFFLLQGTRKVACIEPAPVLAANIQKHLERNGLQNRVKVFPVALGPADGQRILALKEEMLGNSLIESPSAAGSTHQVTVPVWRFSRLLGELRWQEVDVVKLDCEGCEFGIFASTPDEVLRRVRVWIMEVHGAGEPITEKLQKLGYEVSYLSKGSAPGICKAYLPGTRVPWGSMSSFSPFLLPLPPCIR